MVRMGIDDFSARLFGKFDGASIPLMGKKLNRGQPALTLTREGHKVSFASPVSGVIVDINPRISATPGLINDAPYTDGWLVLLYCPNLKQDLKHLLFMETSREFLDTTVNRLYAFLEEEAGIKAADGGTLVPDIFGNLPGISWDRLVTEFIAQGL
jgi:glycine cleavage system H lipoate-binding protein